MEHVFHKEAECLRDSATGTCFEIVDRKARTNIEEIKTIVDELTGSEGGQTGTNLFVIYKGKPIIASKPNDTFNIDFQYSIYSGTAKAGNLCVLIENDATGLNMLLEGVKPTGKLTFAWIKSVTTDETTGKPTSITVKCIAEYNSTDLVTTEQLTEALAGIGSTDTAKTFIKFPNRNLEWTQAIFDNFFSDYIQTYGLGDGLIENPKVGDIILLNGRTTDTNKIFLGLAEITRIDEFNNSTIRRVPNAYLIATDTSTLETTVADHETRLKALEETPAEGGGGMSVKTYTPTSQSDFVSFVYNNRTKILSITSKTFSSSDSVKAYKYDGETKQWVENGTTMVSMGGNYSLHRADSNKLLLAGSSRVNGDITHATVYVSSSDTKAIYYYDGINYSESNGCIISKGSVNGNSFTGMGWEITYIE